MQRDCDRWQREAECLRDDNNRVRCHVGDGDGTVRQNILSYQHDFVLTYYGTMALCGVRHIRTYILFSKAWTV